MVILKSGGRKSVLAAQTKHFGIYLCSDKIAADNKENTVDKM